LASKYCLSALKGAAEIVVFGALVGVGCAKRARAGSGSMVLTRGQLVVDSKKLFALPPLRTERRVLDGGIFEHNGYGWGNNSWTVVQGAEAVRVVCMICGIQQPLRIKGESPRRALSILLQELSVYPRK
jgi:hypothetical protein